MTLLQRHRKARGLTQTKLAKRLKLKTPSTISKWESGESEPNPALLPKLARIFGINALELTRVIAPETPHGADAN